MATVDGHVDAAIQRRAVDIDADAPIHAWRARAVNIDEATVRLQAQLVDAFGSLPEIRGGQS